MIKILQRGKENIYDIKCNICNSIIEFSNSDEFIKSGYDINFDITTNYYIKCPVCKKDILTNCYTNEGIFTYKTKKGEL